MTSSNESLLRGSLRRCLRDPIGDIAFAAQLLDEAVTAHLSGQRSRAAALISRSNLPSIREWTDSLWGKASPYVKPCEVANAPPHLAGDQQVPVRMPRVAEQKRLQARDGFHCRFCGIPLITKEVRRRVTKAYPELLIWGRRNADQHAAFQAMWLQYDHLRPHSRGGNNSFENLVVTCAPCNYARMDYTLEELSLIDPRTREPVRSTWDGLERFR